MSGSADDRLGAIGGRAARKPATLLLVILVLLALTGCREPDSAGSPSGEPPASPTNEPPASPTEEPPASPTNLRYAQEGSTVRLSWDAALRADRYVVRHHTRPRKGDVLDSVTETTYVHTCPSLEENYYWVMACNGRGCSEVDSENPLVAHVAPTGTATPPATLADAIALDSATEVRRLVDAGADVNGRDCSGTPVLFAAIGAGNTEIVRVLLDAGAHVESSREALLYAHTEGMQRLLLDAGAIPPFPPLIQVVDRTESSLTIQVDAPTTDLMSGEVRRQLATYYSLRRRSEAGSGEWVDLPHHVPGSDFHDTGLGPDATFFYMAQACSSGGCSVASDATGGVTESAGRVDPPSTPGNVRGHKLDVGGGTDDAGVSWKPVAGATYYEVYQDSSSSLDAEVSAPQTSYRDYSPNESWFAFTTTQYSVRACNKAGCSPLSAVVVVH